MTIDEQLFDAARKGDVGTLRALLDEHPDKLAIRGEPYESTLLHAGARHLSVVDLLLNRGLDVNARERGDNTYAMHWAAAAGELEVVKRLADAGGDVIGEGDDHEMGVIGWASCWDGCNDDAHRAVVDFLASHGATHHIFSAIAMNLADEVRRIVAADPSALNKRMSRNELNQTPLHFAVRMRRPEVVALLVGLGADPLAVDVEGFPVSAHASTPDIDRSVMEKIRGMLAGELDSAERGRRPPNIRLWDLVAVLALRDRETAEHLLRGDPTLAAPGGRAHGALHLMAKRGDVAAVKWLLERGADPNGRWGHWDAQVTPLHLAVLARHADVVRTLLDAGADPTIRDSVHDSDPIGWAEFFQAPDLVRILKEHRA